MNRKCFFVLIIVLGLIWLFGNQIIVIRHLDSRPHPQYTEIVHDKDEYHNSLKDKIDFLDEQNNESNEDKVPEVFVTEAAIVRKNCICTGTPTNYKECFFEYQCKNSSSPSCKDCSGAPSNTKSNQEVKILLYNNVNDDISIYRNEMVTQCSVKCHFDRFGGNPSGYDGIIFSIIKFDGALPSKKPGQQFIAHIGGKYNNRSFNNFLSESIDSYYGRHLRNPHYMANFDIQATYLQSSNLYWNYMSFEYGADTEKKFTTPVNYAQKTQKSPIVWISTNCKALNQREKFVEQIMQFIPVDSYGSCLHNKDFPFQDTRHGHGWEDRKMKIVSEYLFVLAFENSNTQDYVTEKFYHAFMAGAVPIYMGAPNIDQFSPGNHSFIKFSDFKSVEHLVEYLQLLISNPVLYNEYHAWRKNGWSSSFADLLPYTYHSLPCRVCEKVAELKNKALNK